MAACRNQGHPRQTLPAHHLSLAHMERQHCPSALSRLPEGQAWLLSLSAQALPASGMGIKAVAAPYARLDMQALCLGSGDIPRTLAGVGTGHQGDLEAPFSNGKLLSSSCAAMMLLQPSSERQFPGQGLAGAEVLVPAAVPLLAM